MDHYQIRHPEIEHLLKQLGNTIRADLPEGWGFALFLYTYDIGALFYLSSGERTGTLDMLREFIRRQEQEAAH